MTLLDGLESQLKGTPHVSRLLFCFGIPDDRKVQAVVDHEFTEWLRQNEGITGILLYIGQAGIQLLEGPTELLFKAIELFYTLTLEPTEEQGPDAGKMGKHSPRHALPLTGIRVLYFTEMHGVRASCGWCSYNHASKLQGGQASTLEDGNCAELVFVVYQKLLVLCLKASDSLDANNADFDKVQGQYRKMVDAMPTAEDVLILHSKAGVDLFFSYAEFEKVFVAPFFCTLHSELLWPIPPALSY